MRLKSHMSEKQSHVDYKGSVSYKFRLNHYKVTGFGKREESTHSKVLGKRATCRIRNVKFI